MKRFVCEEVSGRKHAVVKMMKKPFLQKNAGHEKIRNRVKELRMVLAKDLISNKKNWRRHPDAQRNALRGVLNEIGYAGALICREDGDGKLVLIDGHLRAGTTPDQQVPVLVLDVDEKEADTLLAVLDPLGGMARSDTNVLRDLVSGIGDHDICHRQDAEGFAGGDDPGCWRLSTRLEREALLLRLQPQAGVRRPRARAAMAQGQVERIQVSAR